MKQKYKKIDIKTKRLVNSLFLWNYQAAFKGRWIEFSDFREYTPSDDARHIDWLVSAREWKTIMRRYREERELDILFVLDLSVSMEFGFGQKKFDTLIEILYLIAFSGIQNGDKVWALLIWKNHSKFTGFKKGNIWLFKILSAVENFELKEPWDFLNLNCLNALPVKNSLVFVFTDSLSVDEKSLKLARIKNDLIYIRISDSFEETLEWKQGILSLWDTKKKIVIDLDNKKKKQRYLDLRQEKKNTLRAMLMKNKISNLEIDEHTDIYKAFLTFMKSREL